MQSLIKEVHTHELLSCTELMITRAEQAASRDRDDCTHVILGTIVHT